MNFIQEKMGSTRRYLMFFSYTGTNFRGSQLQNCRGSQIYETVQYALETGLKHVFELTEERPIRVCLGSRTDTGVHALRAALHADLPQFKGHFIKPESLRNQLNNYFKGFRDVRILEVYNVPDSFSIFREILDKTYVYRFGIVKKKFIDNETKKIFVPPIMEVDRTFLSSTQLDFDLKKVEEATLLFEGEKDFGAIVGKPKHNIRPTICNIQSFKVEQTQPLIPLDPLSEMYNFYNFICRGNRFLYRMVRRMVCLTLSVGYNILTLDEIQKLFDNPVPSSWPKRTVRMVPGCGLYLVNVNIDLQNIHQPNHMAIENKTEEIPTVVES